MIVIYAYLTKKLQRDETSVKEFHKQNLITTSSSFTDPGDRYQSYGQINEGFHEEKVIISPDNEVKPTLVDLQVPSKTNITFSYDNEYFNDSNDEISNNLSKNNSEFELDYQVEGIEHNSRLKRSVSDGSSYFSTNNASVVI